MSEQISATPLVPGQGRPSPPPVLTDQERQIWIDAVEARPLNFFDAATHPLLEMYCQHVILCRQAASELRVRGSTPKRREECRKATMAKKRRGGDRGHAEATAVDGAAA
jgi:phage terminase small subunit